MRTIEEIKAELDIEKQLQSLLERSKDIADRTALVIAIEMMSVAKDISIERHNELCTAEREGRCKVLPCDTGNTVYIIEKCENIDSQLDGTLWDSNGYYGTATGYYCPYEGCCPHDTDDCKTVKDKYTIFEDAVKEIHIFEDDMLILFENCHGKYEKDFGKTVFLTNKAAEAALKEREKNVQMP